LDETTCNAAAVTAIIPFVGTIRSLTHRALAASKAGDRRDQKSVPVQASPMLDLTSFRAGEK